MLIELAQYREQPVTETTARKLAQQINAVAYIESSALTQRNLKEVFDQAILAALEGRESTPGALSKKPSKQRSSSRQKKVEKVVDNVSENGESSPLSLRLHNNHSQHHVLDYTDEDDRKRGWRRLCCFS